MRMPFPRRTPLFLLIAALAVPLLSGAAAAGAETVSGAEEQHTCTATFPIPFGPTIRFTCTGDHCEHFYVPPIGWGCTAWDDPNLVNG